MTYSNKPDRYWAKQCIHVAMFDPDVDPLEADSVRAEARRLAAECQLSESVGEEIDKQIQYVNLQQASNLIEELQSNIEGEIE